MADGFKESDFQNGVFIPYLSAPPPDGLDWILGKPADIDAALDRAGADAKAADLLRKNFLRVIPEATFERQFPQSNKRIRRRPDLVFFVNGLYLAYAELKTAQTGQAAAGHGRKKIAYDKKSAGSGLTFQHSAQSQRLNPISILVLFSG